MQNNILWREGGGMETNSLDIVTNSFYDIPANHYTEEELVEYKKRAGIPLFNSYDEIKKALMISNE